MIRFTFSEESMNICWDCKCTCDVGVYKPLLELLVTLFMSRMGESR